MGLHGHSAIYAVAYNVTQALAPSADSFATSGGTPRETKFVSRWIHILPPAGLANSSHKTG
eukprot:1605459-Pyramimonas_sp.AAC.1